MIHHCDVVATPRKVTIIPTVPAPDRGRAVGAWVGALSTLLLLLSVVAASLGAQGTAPRADSAKAAPTRNIAWTSSRRSYVVGDIIKVVVDEYALASANKDNSASASRRRSLDLGISPPSTGSATPGLGSIDASYGAGDGSTTNQRGNATRDTRYAAEIAVRVVAVQPNGMLQVKGTKLIDVDKNKTTLTLAGFVSPIDVNSSDVVGSDHIADIQLAYAAKGSLGKPKSGIVTKILGIFWP